MRMFRCTRRTIVRRIFGTFAKHHRYARLTHASFLSRIRPSNARYFFNVPHRHAQAPSSGTTTLFFSTAPTARGRYGIWIVPFRSHSTPRPTSTTLSQRNTTYTNDIHHPNSDSSMRRIMLPVLPLIVGTCEAATANGAPHRPGGRPSGKSVTTRYRCLSR